jgi:tRNA uracil 4-sulfurtransferase
MHFLIRLFPEITIKSPAVRQRLGKQLADNIRLLLRREFPSASVKHEWDRIDLRIKHLGEDDSPQPVIDCLSRIPGIAHFARVWRFQISSLDDIYRCTGPLWGPRLAGKTFRVRAKRRGKQGFGSLDMEQYVGGGLHQHYPNAGVKLTDPDITVPIELMDDQLFVVDERHAGLGGFPVGSQGEVLSLISGGFDSCVASYHSIKRGLRTHYCFFNLGGKSHELGVKDLALHLWKQYGASHRVKFITVPFEAVVTEILTQVEPSCMGVVLKRQMMRAASQIADRAGCEALVTGEAVAQVSSQTLTNLALIDKASDHLTLRPLAFVNKGDIIDTARELGIDDKVARIPEYCGVISIKPSAAVTAAALTAAEQALDPAILAAALAASRAQPIDSLVDELANAKAPDVQVVVQPDAGDAIIDIRHPDERDQTPLVKPVPFHGEILTIPFFELQTAFSQLRASRRYLLYCDRGIMSRLQAEQLKASGFGYVGIYQPEGSRSD